MAFKIGSTLHNNSNEDKLKASVEQPDLNIEAIFDTASFTGSQHLLFNVYFNSRSNEYHDYVDFIKFIMNVVSYIRVSALTQTREG